MLNERDATLWAKAQPLKDQEAVSAQKKGKSRREPCTRHDKTTHNNLQRKGPTVRERCEKTNLAEPADSATHASAPPCTTTRPHLLLGRAAPHLGEPRSFEVRNQQDVEQDQHPEQGEHQEGIERPRAVVIVRPIEAGFLMSGWGRRRQRREGMGVAWARITAEIDVSERRAPTIQ